jgi:hypothetical protein
MLSALLKIPQLGTTHNFKQLVLYGLTITQVVSSILTRQESMALPLRLGSDFQLSGLPL